MSDVESGAPFAITISRQLGSGGAYLGRTLASELGISFADRNILEKAADTLEVETEAIEQQDESSPSLVESMMLAFTYGVPDANYVPPTLMPSYEQVREAETAAILEIASRQSTVIVGRGGGYLLSRHPRHLSVFLHADINFRVRRVQNVYALGVSQALRAIGDSDRSRGRYLRELTGRDWSDTTQYDVALCTSRLGLMVAGRILVDLAKARFHDCTKKPHANGHA